MRSMVEGYLAQALAVPRRILYLRAFYPSIDDPQAGRPRAVPLPMLRMGRMRVRTSSPP